MCSQCHQADLSGSDQAPSLAGGEFLDRWNDQSVGDLADRIRLTMPQDDIGSLNVQMSADITAYVLQANNFPAGQEELKADRSAMKSRGDQEEVGGIQDDPAEGLWLMATSHAEGCCDAEPEPLKPLAVSHA